MTAMDVEEEPADYDGIPGDATSLFSPEVFYTQSVTTLWLIVDAVWGGGPLCLRLYFATCLYSDLITWKIH